MDANTRRFVGLFRMRPAASCGWANAGALLKDIAARDA